eukprot:5691030-Prymnesium_polylepis.1
MLLGRLASRCARSPSLLRFALPVHRAPIDSFHRGPILDTFHRGLSSAALDPYKALGLSRDASDDEIKKAYRAKALSTHPDRHPDAPDAAQERFAQVGNAYEILRDPAKRQEYDMTGSVGGGSPGHSQQAEMLRRWQQHMMHRQQQMQQQRRQPPPRTFPQPDMEAWIRPDVAAIHSASRASGIDTGHDEVRATLAGKLGVVAQVGPDAKSLKVRVMLSPGRAAELWFGAGALWDPRLMAEGLHVKICPDVEGIHRASRASGIGTDHESRRANCAGKTGTVLK